MHRNLPSAICHLPSAQRARRLAALALLAALLLSLLPIAPARAERWTTTPTGWWWFSSTTIAGLKDKIDQGFRLTDIEVASVAPFRVSASLVRNTGVHAKAWWWYYGVTPDVISDKLDEHNARLIDLERYVVDGEARYAAVMVRNTGADAKAWWWYYGVTTDFISDRLSEHNARLVEIDTYVTGGQRRYNVIMIRNAGADAKAWWWYYNVSPAFISDRLRDNNARLIDLESHGSDTFTVVMERNEGDAWWWYYGLTSTNQIKHYVALKNARIIDIEPYAVGGQRRYAIVLLQNGDPPRYDIPVRGTSVPQLKAFDDAIVEFMDQRSIPGATLAVMKDGQIVLERGYGWKDKLETEAMPPNALLRLASVTKPFTAAAIRRLAAQGQLNLTDRAFCLPGSPANCHLNISPWPNPAVFDARLRNITIQQLLNHTGGWDLDISGYDPMFQAGTIAADMGIASPPSQTNIARWMLGKTLDYTPGSPPAAALTPYSNFGYMLLGLIVEQVSGQNYASYVQDELFNPNGAPDSEVMQGRSLAAWQNPREPYYSHPGTTSSVYAPYGTVEWPYGGWNHEAHEANGGMIASARAVAQFLDAYWISGQPRNGNGSSFTFFGSLPGTYTMARQRSDGVNIVVLFNQRTDPSGLAYDTIREVMDDVADGIALWPGDVIPALLPAIGLNHAVGRPGSFFTLRGQGLEPNQEFTVELTRLADGSVRRGAATSDADGSLALLIDTAHARPGDYELRLRPARTEPEGREEALLSEEAPSPEQTRGEEGDLVINFALDEGSELRPREEGLEAPALATDPSDGGLRIFLPVVSQ